MSTLVQLVSSLPFLVIYLVAGALAVARWDRHPTTSLLVVTAAGIAVVSKAVWVAIPLLLDSSKMDTVTTMTIASGITTLTSTVGLGCLVAAAFTDRSTRTGPPPQFR